MAGTLTISTLSDGTNSTSATNPIRGSARAWVNWNGTNGSIRSSYNVSSVTRTNVGQYTVTFTTAFANANYASTGSAGGAVRNNTVGDVAFPESLYAAATVGVDVQYSHTVAFDAPVISVACFSS